MTPISVMTFAELLEWLHREQVTGPVTLHCSQGIPINVEIPKEPTRIKLDRRVKAA